MSVAAGARVLSAAPAETSALSQLASMDGAGDGNASYLPVPPPAAEDIEADEPLSISLDTLPDELAFMVREPAEADPAAQYFDLSRLDDKDLRAAASAIPYLNLVLKTSKAKGVDPALVLAVIQQESRFNPKARSGAGALGLMQMMPATARIMGLKDPQKLFIPKVSVKYGTQFIKDLWAEFGRKKDLANLSAEDINSAEVINTIAAYNAGPGNVKKYHGVPPFKETQEYVVRVRANFKKYKKLLSAAPAH